jgi:hypothetical protein
MPSTVAGVPESAAEPPEELPELDEAAPVEPLLDPPPLLLVAVEPLDPPLLGEVLPPPLLDVSFDVPFDDGSLVGP